MRSRSAVRTTLAGLVTGVLVAALAPAATAADVTTPFKVGIITCKSGALADYGDAYLDGWAAGLKFATKAGKVGKRKVEVLSIVDDKTGDIAGATAAFKDLVGKGAKIIAGTCSSATALALAPLAAQNKVIYMPGPAASDLLTGVNRYTFRTGRQTEQDVVTSLSFLSNKAGESVITMAEDYAFGQGNATAMAYYAPSNVKVLDPVLVPLTTKDMTTYAKRVKDSKATVTYVAFSALNPWIALAQQGVVQTSQIVTGLANRETWDLVGSIGGADFSFLSHYFAGAGKTAAEKSMLAYLAGVNKDPDLFNPDGFNAAMMVARAAAADKTGKDNVNTIIKSLEGYSFVSVKGKTTVRASDHALIQPMFQAKLVKGSNGKFTPQLIKTVQNVAPEFVEMKK